MAKPGFPKHQPKTQSRERGRVVARPRVSATVQSALTWGAAAVSSAGTVDIEVDEAIEANIWQVTINLPLVYLSVRLSSLVPLKKTFKLLAGEAPATDEVELGDSVHVVRDDESANRFFVWLNRGQPQSIQVVLENEVVADVCSAMQDAIAQLDE
jgi:hypothetical protein